ncbi:MAG: hypothetical protein JSU90_12890 [Nitrospiraceae bacterium]|nr:MAG: hypothetical protein JSU90_12890 [Nitrospiraceae bacterium]
MGFLNKLFSKETNFPELDRSSDVARTVDNFRRELEGLAQEVDDPLEVIPASDTVYVFIGKPPRKFGIAWIKDGRVHNFKTLAQEEGVHEMKLMMMSEQIRKAYEKNSEAPRYSTTVADQKVVVTQSEPLAKELKEIIH